jgi:hypothetical protein
MYKQSNKIAKFGIMFLVVFSVFFTYKESALAFNFLELPSTSSNWSGYVATGSYFTGVEASWYVPKSTPASALSANAEWVGIGGHASPDLIQAGTMAIFIDGKLEYRAWVETLPQDSEALPISIKDGDLISVSLEEISPDTWLMVFSNKTTNEKIEKTINYSSSHSSSEWIEESPLINGRPADLANYQTAIFQDAHATTPNGKVNLVGANARPIIMADSNLREISGPGNINDNGSGFEVVRLNPISYQAPEITPTITVVEPVPIFPTTFEQPTITLPMIPPAQPPAYQPIYTPPLAPVPVNRNSIVVISFSPITGQPVTPITVSLRNGTPTKSIKVAKKPAKKKSTAKSKTKKVTVKKKSKLS